MDTTAEAKLCWAKVVVRVADANGTGRELLRTVYGCAAPGNLHAIMGPSGASPAARSVAALDACADGAALWALHDAPWPLLSSRALTAAPSCPWPHLSLRALTMRAALLPCAPGCGKTTLLNALSGRLAHTATLEGSIKVNGHKTRLSYGKSAYVTQDEVLIAMLTVRETIMYAARLRLAGDSALHDRVTDGVITDLGLTEVRDRLVMCIASVLACS